MYAVYHREVEILVVRVPAAVEIGGISVAFWLKKREKYAGKFFSVASYDCFHWEISQV